MSCHLFFERFQVERSRDMNRRKFHETFGELACDLLHENDTPKPISEPCIVVDGSTQTGAFERVEPSVGQYRKVRLNGAAEPASWLVEW